MIISSQRFHSGVTAGAHRAMRRYVQLGSDSRNLGGDSLPDRRFDHTNRQAQLSPATPGPMIKARCPAQLRATRR